VYCWTDCRSKDWT